MKRVVTLVFALMMVFALSANSWAQDDDLCLDCGKASAQLDEVCPPAQDDCEPYAEPPRLVIDPCVCSGGCVGGDFWTDGDFVGVSVESLTPGVYINSGYVKIKLFPEYKGSDDDPNVACNYVDPDEDGPNDYRGDDEDNDRFWDFIWGRYDSADTTTDHYGLLKYYHDKNASAITPDFGVDETDCELDTSNQKITYVSTCDIDDNAWILDIDDTEDTDNDGDGPGEDKANHLGDDNHYVLVEVPDVIVNWSEIESNGLVGTVGQVQVCILSMKDAVSGLCTDCDVKCCCPLDAVQLCDELEMADCMFFPYLLYKDTQGCSSSIVVTNQLPDVVSVDEMSITVEVIDGDGEVNSGTFAAFDAAVQAFTVDGLIDAAIGSGVVKAGAVAVSITSNFWSDGWSGMLCDFGGGTSFGGTTLVREYCDRAYYFNEDMYMYIR